MCSDAFAGVERYVTTLTTGLARHGCRVVVIGGQRDRVEPSVVTTDHVEWLPATDVRQALGALLHQRHLDVVHAHMTAAELAAVMGSAKHRAPIVATRHFARRRGSHFMSGVAGRFLTRRIDAQLAISRYVADSIEGTSIVVPPGTAHPDAVPDAADRERTVLVVQRLEAEKRTDLALEAWRNSGLGTAGWQLLIVGDGSERRRLEAQAAQLGVAASCAFLGRRNDVADLQLRASMQLAPRPDEPFGLSVVEAMAAALPVVAARGGGHLETVGLAPDAALYSPFDIGSAGRMLAELAGDLERRHSYGTALRHIHSDVFRVERQVATTLETYRSLLRQR